MLSTTHGRQTDTIYYSISVRDMGGAPSCSVEGRGTVWSALLQVSIALHFVLSELQLGWEGQVHTLQRKLMMSLFHPCRVSPRRAGKNHSAPRRRVSTLLSLILIILTNTAPPSLSLPRAAHHPTWRCCKIHWRTTVIPIPESRQLRPRAVLLLAQRT